MYISKRIHSVKVTHLPWAQAPPCLRTERKARHTALGRVELCGAVADGSGFDPRIALMAVAAAWLTRRLGCVAYTSGSDSHGGMVDVMVGGCNGDVDGEGTELWPCIAVCSKRKSGDVYIWWSFFLT